MGNLGGQGYSVDLSRAYLVCHPWVATQGGSVSGNLKLFADDSRAFYVNITSEWGFIKTTLHSSATANASSGKSRRTIWNSCSHSSKREFQNVPVRSQGPGSLGPVSVGTMFIVLREGQGFGCVVACSLGRSVE